MRNSIVSFIFLICLCYLLLFTCVQERSVSNVGLLMDCDGYNERCCLHASPGKDDKKTRGTRKSEITRQQKVSEKWCVCVSVCMCAHMHAFMCL